MQQVQPPPGTLHTTRLVLRRPTLEDARDIFERYTQDPVVTQYLRWRPHKDIAQTESFIQRCLHAWDTGQGFPYVITLRQERGPIGMIDLRISGHRAEIGYVLARAHWGHGYMTEAAKALVDWALNQPAIYRVWAVCDVENAASIRVLEKVGMKREGVLRRWLIHPNVSDEPRDCFCYAMTK